jgi:hypothetical protein
MKEINLIPTDILYLIKWNFRRIFSVTILFLLSLMVLSWIAMNILSGHYHHKMEADSRKLSAIRRQQIRKEKLIDELAETAENREAVGKAASAVIEFRRTRILWSNIIGRLTMANLKGMWFRSFRVVSRGRDDPDIIEIKGTTLNKSSIAELLYYLESSPQFIGAILKRGTAEKISSKPVYDFSIECRMVGK